MNDFYILLGVMTGIPLGVMIQAIFDHRRNLQHDVKVIDEEMLNLHNKLANMCKMLDDKLSNSLAKDNKA